MTKSFLTKTSIAAGILSLSMINNTANAINFKFYAGAGMDYTKYDFSKEFRKGWNGKFTAGRASLAPILGVKFNENFGLEAGFDSPTKMNYEGGNEKSRVAKINSMHLDLVGYMPLPESKFNLIAGLGIGKVNLKLSEQWKDFTDDDSFTRTQIEAKNKLAYRIKIGAEYSITDNFAVRGLLTYQILNNKLDYKDTDTFFGALRNQSSHKLLKNSKSIGLSAIYSF